MSGVNGQKQEWPHKRAQNAIRKQAEEEGFKPENPESICNLIDCPEIQLVNQRQADYVGKREKTYLIIEVVNGDDDRLVFGKMFLDAYLARKWIDEKGGAYNAQLWLVFIFGVNPKWDEKKEDYERLYRDFYKYCFSKMIYDKYVKNLEVRMFIWNNHDETITELQNLKFQS